MITILRKDLWGLALFLVVTVVLWSYSTSSELLSSRSVFKPFHVQVGGVGLVEGDPVSQSIDGDSGLHSTPLEPVKEEVFTSPPVSKYTLPLEFTPGSLTIPAVDTVNACYLNRLQDHVGEANFFSNQKHNFIVLRNLKSSSSAMQVSWGVCERVLE